MAAQLAVALHFYHPLAHWLAARLRLEQELAADAWAARLSGGKPSYLATLAQMALRRDGPAITWPARAFLPSHGTFIRRIEMLKNHGPIRHVSLPLVARVLTVAALAAIGLLVAGLRGPVGESSALAQDRPNARPPRRGHPTTWPSCRRMPGWSSPCGPRRCCERRDVRSLLNRCGRARQFQGQLPVSPEDVEQLLVFWESGWRPMGQRGGPRSPLPSGFVVRMIKPQDWKAVIAKAGRTAIGRGAA